MGKYTISEGKVFEALPEDKYQVEVYDAEPFIGTAYQSSAPQEQVKFTFVILNDDKLVPDEGILAPARGRRLWLQTTTQFSPVGSKKPTNLTLLTAATFGHELTPEEVAKFDEQSMLGKQLCLMVGQKKRQDGTTGNKILSFSSVVKELPKYDDTEFAERQKVKKSESAVTDTGDFEKDMDAMVASRAKK